MRLWGGLAIVVAACALMWVFWPDRVFVPSASARLADVLGGRWEGFASVTEPREFRFPEDHGPHPEYRTEWWYVTGNLETPDGRPFGYQVTFFRSGIRAEEAPVDSAWSSHEVYSAHVSLSDVEGGEFYGFERRSRGAAGLAGSKVRPLEVWVEDWRLEGVEVDPFKVKLSVKTESVTLDLMVTAKKPVVLHGDRGMSAKGKAEGQASYYYSYTRLATEGRIVLNGESFEVAGSSWWDREWSSGVLGEGQIGWDWFALQFEDQTEIMLARLRRADGSTDYSAGTFVDEDGATSALTWDDFDVTSLGTWKSPRTGAEYPSGWRLMSNELEIVVTPRLQDQELQTHVVYWEGAVTIEGKKRGSPIKGVGYVELTGYIDQ